MRMCSSLCPHVRTLHVANSNIHMCISVYLYIYTHIHTHICIHVCSRLCEGGYVGPLLRSLMFNDITETTAQGLGRS